MYRKSMIIMFLLVVVSCSNHPESCADSDKHCLYQQLLRHPARQIGYWQHFLTKPVNDRIFIVPQEVVDYIDLDNRRNDFPNKPAIPKPTDEFMQAIKSAFSEVPDSVKKHLGDRFAGIFLIEDLGGSGYTDYILDENSKAVAGFVVLDVDALKKRTANEWASWKESTPFRDNSSFEIEAIIQAPENNNIKYAIQYILLHELGHIISINSSYHPVWTSAPRDVKSTDEYPFFQESWKIDQDRNRYISKYDAGTFPERDQVTYYFGAKLNSDQMLDVYRNLEETNFVTLYAATSPGDDWAESFVSYVHTKLLNKPFAINIKKDGELLKSFDLCWGTQRCAVKEKYLESLLGGG